MATSPNYAWAEPDNSSLVKNGASDIRTLGDAIDTSVWNVGFGQASKNKIINGDFAINQRAFASTTSNGTFIFDRFSTLTGGGCTFSAQTFTAGTAPVTGYESKNFVQLLTTGQSGASVYSILSQPIEDVRTFANQTVTFSFWAKAASGTPKIGVELNQAFGSGGSSEVNTALGAVTISTSWARYSKTVALPSVSGKTIGAGSFLGAALWVSAGTDFATRASSIGIQSNTFQIWGVQVEYGSVATPFQTASGGSIQGELAMCQRYYWRSTATEAGYTRFPGFGLFDSTTNSQTLIQPPMTMRTKPTSVDYSTIGLYDGASVLAITAWSITTGNAYSWANNVTIASGGVAKQSVQVIANNSASAYLGFSAEL